MRCIKTGIAYNSWKTTEIVGKEPRYELKKSQFFSYTKKMSDPTKKFLVETLTSMLTYEDIEIVVPDKSRPYFGKDADFTKSKKLGMWTVQSMNNQGT